MGGSGGSEISIAAACIRYRTFPIIPYRYQVIRASGD